MSVKVRIEKSKNFFGFRQTEVGSEIDSTLIYEETTREIEYLLGESDDTDSTDGIFDLLTKLSDQVQGEFEEILDSNDSKKRFPRALLKIFALLLNAKVGTTMKIIKILKIAIKTTLKIWSEQN